MSSEMFVGLPELAKEVALNKLSDIRAVTIPPYVEFSPGIDSALPSALYAVKFRDSSELHYPEISIIISICERFEKLLGSPPGHISQQLE
jgi:hypothetical protein